MLLLVKSLLAHKAATAVAVAVMGTGATTAAATGVLPRPELGSPEPIAVLTEAATGEEQAGEPAVTSTTIVEETPGQTSSTTVAEAEATTTTTVTEEPLTTQPPSAQESSTTTPSEGESEEGEEPEAAEARTDNHGSCVSAVARQQRDTPPGRERGRVVSEAARTGCRPDGATDEQPEAGKGTADATVPVPSSTTPTTERPAQQRGDRSGRPERDGQSVPDTTVPAPQPAPTIVTETPETGDSALGAPEAEDPAAGGGKGGGRSDR